MYLFFLASTMALVRWISSRLLHSLRGVEEVAGREEGRGIVKKGGRRRRIEEGGREGKREGMDEEGWLGFGLEGTKGVGSGKDEGKRI